MVCVDSKWVRLVSISGWGSGLYHGGDKINNQVLSFDGVLVR